MAADRELSGNVPGTDVPLTALEQAFAKIAAEEPELFDRLMLQLKADLKDAR